MYDVAVIGGGIVGLAVAKALTDRFDAGRVVVLEKEQMLGAHQTGHNSGVIHSGIYYRPGSLKAQLATRASTTMVEFCAENGIPHKVCGKLVVATTDAERTALDELRQRAIANGIPARVLERDEIGEREPHLRCTGALLVPTAGIVDFARVAQVLASIARERGVEIRTRAKVAGLRRTGTGWTIRTTSDAVEARFVVTCAGLHSDRVARAGGADPGARIVPFRGEYFDVVEPRRSLVRGLIYPVPDLRFPFLGVHLTRGIHGEVHAGPNAVLALSREGYRRRDVSPRDVADLVRFPGFWRMAAKHWRYGAAELARSLLKRRFVQSVQRLVPELAEHDLVRAPAGVRAQAVDSGGGLVDDFLLVQGEDIVHVTNAPSPAATASLEIGRMIAARVPLPR